MRNNADYPVSQVGSNHESPLKHAIMIHRVAPGGRRDTMKREKQESD
jgi:hypothetical protein